MNDLFTPLIVKSLKNNYILDGYFALSSPQLPNWMIFQTYVLTPKKIKSYHMILPCSIVSLLLFIISNIKIKILNLGSKLFCSTNDNLLLLLLLFYVPMYCLQ